MLSDEKQENISAMSEATRENLMDLISKSNKDINLLQTYNISFRTNFMSISKDVTNKEVTFDFFMPPK